MAHYDCRECGEPNGVSKEHCPKCKKEKKTMKKSSSTRAALTAPTTESPFNPYEYCVRPVYGYRWRCFMRYNVASPYVSLPMAWDKAFMTEEDAERNCREHAKARRDEHEFLNKPTKYLGTL